MNTATTIPAPMPTELTFGKCTLYLQGEFFGNFTRIACKSLKVTRIKYAQYDNALRLEWMEPRKRSPRGTVLTYRPRSLVLDGWDTPEPDDMMGPKDADGASRSRHLSHAEDWRTEFDALIATSGVVVLCDMRGDQNCASVPVAKAVP